VYDVSVRATDADGLFDEQTIAVTVTDVAEGTTHDVSGGPEDVTGTLAELSGDTIIGFSSDDKIVIVGSALQRSAITVAGGVMSFDTDADGTADGVLNLPGTFTGGDFMLARTGGNSVVTFHSFLP